MIYQQYYTRDRKGVFSSTPGYDTVARSPGLDDDFIINTLHNLCFYEVPELLAGESDKDKYPKALFYANVGDGKIIIGQSVFAGRDYTHERVRYFTHCYVISGGDEIKYIENPERIIYSSGFKENYDIEKGTSIGSIPEIKCDKTDDVFDSACDMLKAASINKDIFESLIKACFDAAAFNKKIYIVVDFNKDTVKVEKGILKYLYRVLPFAVRKKLGFITYVKQPEIKDLIHIEFIHNGSTKISTRWIKSGYVFDISNNEFYLDGIDGKKHAFIEFVLDNIDNIKVLNDFFHKADSFCSGLEVDDYDNLLMPKKNGKNHESKFQLDKNSGDLRSEDKNIFSSICKKIHNVFRKS